MNAPEPGMNGTMYQAAMAAKRKREIAGMEAEITRLREELAPLRELVGVDGRASSALSDIQHWQKMMDKADERDAATGRADDLQSAWDEVLGSHRVNGPSYREAAQALIARVDAAAQQLLESQASERAMREAWDWAVPKLEEMAERQNWRVTLAEFEAHKKALAAPSAEHLRAFAYDAWEEGWNASHVATCDPFSSLTFKDQAWQQSSIRESLGKEGA